MSRRHLLGIGIVTHCHLHQAGEDGDEQTGRISDRFGLSFIPCRIQSTYQLNVVCVQAQSSSSSTSSSAPRNFFLLVLAPIAAIAAYFVASVIQPPPVESLASLGSVSADSASIYIQSAPTNGEARNQTSCSPLLSSPLLTTLSDFPRKQCKIENIFRHASESSILCLLAKH